MMQNQEDNSPMASHHNTGCEDDYRRVMELLFFAYRDFTGEADRILQQYGFGRAHHRALYFTARRPGLSVSELLDILKITKQSLNRVLSQLVEEGYILQESDNLDRRRRQLFLTESGQKLDRDLTMAQGTIIAKALETLSDDQVTGFREALKGLMTTSDYADFVKSITP